ncbi:MAG: insulinase family protein, partial [Bacteroidota bacterium]
YYANTDKEVTTFTFEVHKDFLTEFYPIVKGLILTPAFSEEDFQRVKMNQQNYVDQVIRASSDEEYSKKALEDLLFRGTNYQHMTQGTSAGVEAITLEDVKRHYAQFFTKSNLMIGVAGKYDDAFLTMIKNDMATLPDTQPVLPEPGKANQPTGIEVQIVAKEGAFGSAIFTGFPLEITRADDDFIPLMVANSYLGEHRKSYSKLYEEIRQKRSMNYGDYSYIEWYDNGGQNMLPPPGVPRSSNYFSIWIRPVQIAKQLKQQYPELAGLKVGHAHFALRMAIHELDKMITNGMSEEDFEATREFLRSYTKLYAQTPERRLGYLMDSRFYGRTDYLAELDGLLANVTLDDVNKAIKKYWQVENMFVTIVTDASEAGPLARSLASNRRSPMSYSNVVKAGLPEDVLTEDALVEKYPLNVKKMMLVESAKTFR